MKTTLALAAALAFASPAFAADEKPKHVDAQKDKDIRKLLQLTGAAQLGAQVMSQILDSFKQSLPNVPASFWGELGKELNPDELVERVIPVYDKQLSDGEIRDLIKFYETPTGKKLIKVMPAITQESMQIGQEWGRQIGMQVMAKVQKEGLDRAKAEQKATKPAEKK